MGEELKLLELLNQNLNTIIQNQGIIYRKLEKIEELCKNEGIARAANGQKLA